MTDPGFQKDAGPGVPTFYFAKFLSILHEKEIEVIPPGGERPYRPIGFANEIFGCRAT